MRVLILGSGGREHAFGLKISQSTLLDKLFIAPGNAGTGNVGENVNIAVDDFKGIKKFVIENKISLVLVGPEDPLVKGIHDFFLADKELCKVTVVGPKQDGARLEGSKEFAKEFMKKHNIPTAKYHSFTKDTLKEGEAYLDTLKAPYVLKADGLAAGKGVLILKDLKEAKKELKSMLTDNKFGEASHTVVIEEFMKGVECSVFVLTDGISYKILPPAKDYKRVGEKDSGLNTGGMGAVSPVPFADHVFMDRIENQIVIPTIKGLKEDKIDYRGFIFIGIMNVGGEPYVIEYNCRMGDPETEVVLPRIKSDMIDLFEGIATQTLSERHLEFEDRSAATIVLVSGGYPEEFENGKAITGLDAAENCIVFHSGTIEKGGKVVTNGGRVIAVTALGKDIEQAVERANKGAEAINYDKKYYRKDIGFDLIKTPQQA